MSVTSGRLLVYLKLQVCRGVLFLVGDGVELKSHVRMAAEFGDTMQHGEDGQLQPYVVRAVKFLKEGIRKYGTTQGCPGCTAANRNAAAVNHSVSCRIRREKLMSEDRRPRYMRVMDRLADAALRKESQEEATATTTAAAAVTATTTATKRSRTHSQREDAPPR